MKKAKIILSCIALLALVGGAVAFKAMTSQGIAYKFAGLSTWTSTTVGATVYSTTVPLCTTVFIAGSTAYLTSDVLAAPTTNVHRTTLSATQFTTTTAVGGPILTVTRNIPQCVTTTTIANSFLTSIQ